jgi:hypothetical protein
MAAGHVAGRAGQDRGSYRDDPAAGRRRGRHSPALAGPLAGWGQLDELRQRAGAGGYHALVELAGWLADHGRLDEVRELVVDHRPLLASWLAQRHELELVRLSADQGDDDARRRLAHWLARLRERASEGDDHARQLLAEWEN